MTKITGTLYLNLDNVNDNLVPLRSIYDERGAFVCHEVLRCPFKAQYGDDVIFVRV